MNYTYQLNSIGVQRFNKNFKTYEMNYWSIDAKRTPAVTTRVFFLIRVLELSLF
jgi:hypothetical protein